MNEEKKSCAICTCNGEATKQLYTRIWRKEGYLIHEIDLCDFHHGKLRNEGNYLIKEELDRMEQQHIGVFIESKSI